MEKKYNKIVIMSMLFLILFTVTGCQKKENNTVTNNFETDNDSKNSIDNTNGNTNDTTNETSNSAQNDSSKNDELIFNEHLREMFDHMNYAIPYKNIGEHNPLITQDYGADPYAMVYGDRVYVYMTQDVYMYDADGKLKENSYGNINKLRCISSSDMVNWTDHGNIHIGGIKGVSFWARNSWAPTATWKEIDGKDKFFLYFSNGAGGIGVLTADSPTGPFRDALGKALITNQTPNCSDVVWLFDPAVLVDDDGRAYLYFGGGIPEGQDESPKTARVIELGSDMISTVGEAVVIDAPYLFEDSGINKIGDTYYYTYCSNFKSRANAKGEYVPEAGEIIYMTSDHPMGPWQYQGSILKNPGHFFGTGGNNHHSMVQFKNQWYMFYHAFLLQDAIGVKGGYRSTNANPVIINSDGSIQSIKGDRAGVLQIGTLNPYDEVMATTMSNNAGLKVVEEDKKSYKDPQLVSVADIEDGDWIQVSSVDFGEKGPDTLTVRFSAEGGSGAIKVCSDNLDGPVITYVEMTDTGSYQKFVDVTVPVKEITGVHDIYFEFAGSGYHFSTWSFGKKF